MDSKERYLEDNIARLIRTGFDPRNRLDPAIREKTKRQLILQIQAESTSLASPVWALVVLAGILALMAGLLVSQILGTGISFALRQPLFIVTMILTVNLVSVPVAGISILRRRRHAYST